MWAATLFLAPGLVVIVYRGITTGLHKFRLVSAEQVVSGLSRAAILVGCLIFGKLTSTEAMLSIAAPVLLGGAAYAFVARRNRPAVPASQREINATVRDIYGYGRRVWFGSIGGILLLRLDQVVVAPLSDLTQLGLYVVAVNVAEILLIVVNAVHDVTFAADAASNDNTRAYSTSRLATAATVAIGLVMAATAPFLVPLLFGEAFRSSVSLVWILVGSIIVLVPGSVAGALLVARGHPQLRSVSLVLGAIVNAIVLIVAVPSTGAVGAAWATLAGNSVFALANLYFAWRRAQCQAELVHRAEPGRPHGDPAKPAPTSFGRAHGTMTLRYGEAGDNERGAASAPACRAAARSASSMRRPHFMPYCTTQPTCALHEVKPAGIADGNTLLSVCRTNVIGLDGTSFEATVPQTWPSRVYFTEPGVHSTPTRCQSDIGRDGERRFCGRVAAAPFWPWYRTEATVLVAHAALVLGEVDLAVAGPLPVVGPEQPRVLDLRALVDAHEHLPLAVGLRRQLPQPQAGGDDASVRGHSGVLRAVDGQHAVLHRRRGWATSTRCPGSRAPDRCCRPTRRCRC